MADGYDGQLYEQQGALPATTGVVVTAGSPANAKGTFVPVFIATRTYSGFLLHVFKNLFGGILAVDLSWSSDASGSGNFITNMILQTARPDQLAYGLHIPMAIPDGATVYARFGASIASNTINMAITGMAGEMESYGVCRSLGASGGTGGPTRGTTVTTVTAGVEASWVELSTNNNGITPGFALTPTVEPVKAVIIFAGNQGIGTGVNARWFWDIGIGAPPTPTVILRDILMASSSLSIKHLPGVIGPIPLHIPETTPVSVRVVQSAGVGTFEISILAFS